MAVNSAFRAGPAIAAAFMAIASQAPPQKFVPSKTLASDLVVKIEQMGTAPGRTNPTSPIAAGSHLVLIDQAGSLSIWNEGGAQPLLGPKEIPQGLKLTGAERILNVASNAAGTTLYVMFISTDAPKGIPRHFSPRDGSDGWYVLYSYAFDGTRLSSPHPIIAMQVRTEGHLGGGLAVLPDGAVLFAAGDNGDSFEDGREVSQDLTVHLAKLLHIDPVMGVAKVVARGVRCVQRLVVTGTGAEARLSFVDPGGWVSEEFNSVSIRDLSGPQLLNFGWGRGADGRSREGTFFIDTLGNSSERIGESDGGYTAPVAEFGREGEPKVAVSGPAISPSSFSRISALFGDLISGAIYAVTGPLTTSRQPVYRVSLVDAGGKPVLLKELAGGQRPDPRFFTFPDGSAGMLLERTGGFYRLTEQKPGTR